MKVSLSKDFIRISLKIATVLFLIATIYVQNLHIRRLEKKCEVINIDQNFGE